MHTLPVPSQATPSAQAEATAALYAGVLRAWNRRDAAAFAAQFWADGHVIGFDGSQMEGADAIANSLGEIFADHLTGSYVGKIREVQALGSDVMLLRAVVGMRPAGHTDLRPDLHAIQSLVAVQRAGQWRIALFQTTPAQFHGRPELVAGLTEECAF